MMIKAKVEGRFLAAIRKRMEKWGQPIGTVIHVGEPAYFWVVHEYGAVAHRISARLAKMIAFPGDDGLVRAPYVDHPGNKALRLVASVEDEIRGDASTRVHVAVLNGGLDDPSLIKAALLEATVQAKETIVQSIAEKMPKRERQAGDPRYAATQSGKLQGQAAADVFRENATVEEVS